MLRARAVDVLVRGHCAAVLCYKYYYAATQNWDRFLPQFVKRNVPRKKKKAKQGGKGKVYTPFPPENHIQPSKVDLQIASGEYFQNEQERLTRKREEKRMSNQV